MPDLLKVEIATPEKLIASQPAESAQIPGKDGYMGILPGHAALLSELGEGELSFTLSGATERYKISGGYVEIRDNHVRVLADKVS
jgi:F-type H+-transporting ATPase subunit epsilon